MKPSPSGSDEICSPATSIRSAANRIHRYCWVTGLKPEKACYYKDLHAHPEAAVEQTIKDCHIQNFSIFSREIEGKEYLMAYLEYTGDNFAADMEKMSADPATVAWWQKTDPCQDPLPDAAETSKIWADATEVFHLN